MRVFDSLEAIPHAFGPTAVTIGKFDGLHLGHQRMLAQLREAAGGSLVPTVLTFDRNPLSLLSPEVCPYPLISNEQKCELLSEAGVEATLMLRFDRELSQVPAERFVTEVLVAALRARLVLVGEDFRFGHRGAGTVALLGELGREHGFQVQRLESVTGPGGRRISSTWVRELLSEGDVEGASALLGRLPGVRGVVVRGAQRGRELGFPTANLSPENEGFIPADGVYAGWLVDGQARLPAAISVGNNPTFEGVPARQVEAHVLDADLDLYERVVTVEFAHRVRGMVRFDSIDALIAGITDDVARVRELLSSP